MYRTKPLRNHQALLFLKDTEVKYCPHRMAIKMVQYWNHCKKVTGSGEFWKL